MDDTMTDATHSTFAVRTFHSLLNSMTKRVKGLTLSQTGFIKLKQIVYRRLDVDWIHTGLGSIYFILIPVGSVVGS